MGHTIDVIITPNEELFISDIVVSQIDLSHHFLIDFKVMVEVNKSLTKLIKYRNLKDIVTLVSDNEVTDKFQSSPITNDVKEKVIIIIIRLTCQFHLKWVARLLCLF